MHSMMSINFYEKYEKILLTENIDNTLWVLESSLITFVTVECRWQLTRKDCSVQMLHFPALSPNSVVVWHKQTVHRIVTVIQKQSKIHNELQRSLMEKLKKDKSSEWRKIDKTVRLIQNVLQNR